MTIPKTKTFLVCGDLHTKFHLFEKLKEKATDKYDKIILLGDYVDDWGAIPEASYNLLNEIINWAKSDRRVVVLLGNHDLSEWLGEPFKCSGFNQNTHNLIASLFKENQYLFRIAYNYSDIIFTHAGITRDWVEGLKILGVDISEESSGREQAEYYSNLLNYAFNARDINEQASKIFNTLAQAGPMRGGFHAPSPIWADKYELSVNPLPRCSQVVGHTPVETITHQYFTDTKSRQLIFCDTHSTLPNGENIGDNSLLELTFNEANGTWLDKVVRLDK